MAVPGSIYKNITLSATVTGTPPPSALDDSGRSTTDQESVISIADAEAAEADAIANGTAVVGSFQLTTNAGNISQVTPPGVTTPPQVSVAAAAAAAVSSAASVAAAAVSAAAAAQALTTPPDIEIPDVEIDEPELNIEDNIEVYAPEDRLPLNLYGDMNRGAGAGRR